ncbi:MAG: carbohydrate kinase family protein [Desulfurococcales archaeon]|nr:carbohydrate kinase family protein [Desulfurococcales archaeon]
MPGLDVLAVGHALVDVRMRVEGFPMPDMEAEILEEERGAGGSAVNVSIDVSLLGGRSGIIAKIGFDGFGRLVVDELYTHQVDTRGLRIAIGKRTGFSIVVIDREGRTAIYGYKGASEDLTPGELDTEIIRDARIVHIASLRPDTSIEAARTARRSGITVSWDPGRRLARMGAERLASLLSNVDIVFANRIEARLLTGADDPVRAAEILARYGPRIVVVKLGAGGALLHDKTLEKPVHRPARPVERIVDTTGAGDAFAAGFLLCLARGCTSVEALEKGLETAALKIQCLGSHRLLGVEGCGLKA